MSTRDLVHELIPLVTAMAPYAWPVTVLILVVAFHNRIKEITEAKFGEKLYVKFGSFAGDLRPDPITESLPRLTPKQLTAPSSAKWGNVGNLFWLGNDLVWTAQIALRGAPKEQIVKGLTQSYHHVSELGLSESTPGKQIAALKSETANLPTTALDAARRNVFAERIYEITRAIEVLLKEQQPGYRPGPES